MNMKGHAYTMELPSPAPPPSQSTFWRFDSPLIYLFGGIAAMLLLIMVALIILACSQRKRRSAASAGNDVESQKGVQPVYNPDDEADVSPKIVVIMAGDQLPTYIATPAEVAAKQVPEC